MGNSAKYIIGAIKNADLAKEYYPNFECWFYIQNATVPKNIIDELIKKDNVQIIYKEGDINTCKQMMQRFESILDLNVEMMMSRNTNTKILLRKKLAVDEWLKFDKLFHIMQDHVHHSFIILGGMLYILKAYNPKIY